MKNNEKNPMERLKKRRDFLRVSQNGTRVNASTFLVQKCPQKESDQGPARLGFIVTKKIGNAVARNRIRRRLKAALHLLEKEREPLARGTDYVIIARSAVLIVPFEHLLEQLKRSLYSCER